MTLRYFIISNVNLHYLANLTGTFLLVISKYLWETLWDYLQPFLIVPTPTNFSIINHSPNSTYCCSLASWWLLLNCLVFSSSGILLVFLFILSLCPDSTTFSVGMFGGFCISFTFSWLILCLSSKPLIKFSFHSLLPLIPCYFLVLRWLCLFFPVFLRSNQVYFFSIFDHFCYFLDSVACILYIFILLAL